MNCRDATELLPSYFDNELEAHQMQAVATHAAGCDRCERELRDFKEIQNLLSSSIVAQVERLDLSSLWPAIEQRLPSPRASRLQRWRAFWQTPADGWWIGAPAFAAAAAAVALAFYLFSGAQPSAAPGGNEVASMDYANSLDYVNSIERLDSDLDSVAVFHDPETRATLLWASDSGPVTEDLQ